jgi:hypothetical protein
VYPAVPSMVGRTGGSTIAIGNGPTRKSKAESVAWRNWNLSDHGFGKMRQQRGSSVVIHISRAIIGPFAMKSN